MSYRYVRVHRENGVFTLVLNRPEKLNAINVQLELDWLHALQEAEADPSIRVIVQCAEGRAFTAGHDMVEVGALIKDLGPAAKDWNNIYAKIWPEGSPLDLVAQYSKPIVSAVHGYVVGLGVPLVLDTDIIVAAEKTVFNMEIVRTGGGAGLVNLLGKLPPKKFHELVYLGKLTVEDMAQFGAVNFIVPPEQVREKAQEIARTIASFEPSALALYKRTFRDAMNRQSAHVVGAGQQLGADSHGSTVDNQLWSMAAEKGVQNALKWRDETLGSNQS
jgi:enoyl-CoA hydratase/carnithine racemase